MYDYLTSQNSLTLYIITCLLLKNKKQDKNARPVDSIRLTKFRAQLYNFLQFFNQFPTSTLKDNRL